MHEHSLTTEGGPLLSRKGCGCVDRMLQYKPLQYRSSQYKLLQYRPLQYRSSQYKLLQYKLLRCKPLQHIWCSDKNAQHASRGFNT
mmetsp:Transcript_28229/g.61974  ORF Transcript_28229/g.61974 Transcript_28229/m.61974 type:complete len:86 (+) Transcript_28229:62-319(+)